MKKKPVDFSELKAIEWPDNYEFLFRVWDKAGIIGGKPVFATNSEEEMEKVREALDERLTKGDLYYYTIEDPYSGEIERHDWYS